MISTFRSLQSLGWVAALLLGACGGGGSPEPRLFELGTDVQVADVDGDGRNDVITLTHLYGDRTPAGQLSIYRQTAPGIFASPEVHGLGCYPWSMTVADVDGDGRPDLVVTDVGAHDCPASWPGKAIYLLRNDPSRPGRFGAPTAVIGNITSYRVAVGDFDGDGVPDLATGDAVASGSGLIVLAQDPVARGSFRAPRSMATGSVVTEIVAGDIDGDGRADLFFHGADASGSALVVMHQQPGGGFATPIPLATQTGLNAQRIAIVDVDGDHRLDLLAHFTPQSTSYTAKLTALVQGPLARQWSLPVDTGLAGIERTDGTAFGDLDSDGAADVVLAGWTGSGGPYGGDWQIDSQASLLRRSSRAGYALRTTVTLPLPADRVAIGDLDGDGRNDVVLFGGASAVQLMLQSPVAPGSFGAPRPLRP